MILNSSMKYIHVKFMNTWNIHLYRYLIPFPIEGFQPADISWQTFPAKGSLNRSIERLQSWAPNRYISSFKYKSISEQMANAACKH